MRRIIIISTAVMLAAFTAAADVRVSPDDGANHSYPAVCRQPAGFVVAWESDGEDGREITVQRLDDNGRAFGGPFRANRDNTGDQQLPDIACREDGSFLLVWESHDQDGLGIFARYFGADGRPRGDEFRVNTHTVDNQRLPRVCVGNDGSGVIVWESFGQGAADRPRIYGQRLAANTLPLGSEFPTDDTVELAHADPDLACLPEGGFIVAWTQAREAGSQIVAKLFDADGDSVNAVVIPNDPDSVHRRHPSIASVNGDQFAIAFEADGVMHLGTVDVTPEAAGQSVVALTAAGRNEAPVVASRATGDVFAVWPSGSVFDFALRGARTDSLATDTRVFSAASSRGGNHGATSPLGRGTDIATAPDGDLIVWQQRDVFADDSSSAIYSRRFRDCIGDCSDNGVVATNELITGVRMALTQAPIDACSRFDANGSGRIEINELVRAVTEAIASICPAPVN